MHSLVYTAFGILAVLNALTCCSVLKEKDPLKTSGRNPSSHPILTKGKVLNHDSEEAIALLKGGWSQCKSTSDCKPDECCATLFVQRRSFQVCKRKPRLSDSCSIFSKPGTLTKWCPCDFGLTCSLSSVIKHKRTYHKRHTCGFVPPMEDELDEKPKTL